MISFPTSDPAGLLSAIRSAIDDRTIRTWKYDKDGDFTHIPEQWIRQAWLRPTKFEGKLVFYIVPPADTHISSATYAVYHGRFIEAVLSHFDDKISGHISASVDPEGRDEIT